MKYKKIKLNDKLTCIKPNFDRGGCGGSTQSLTKGDVYTVHNRRMDTKNPISDILRVSGDDGFSINLTEDVLNKFFGITEIEMTTQEKIALRDKSRKDFEGKIYKNNFIFEISISIFDSGEVHIVLFNVHMDRIYNFNVSQYDKILSQCEKPFPKEGFSIRLKDDEIFKGMYNLCKYISLHLGCSMSVLNENVNTEKTLYPEVTLEEVKKEAIRIIKTI